MTLAALEAYLHAQIPLSFSMGVRVVACDKHGATLSAPLALNVNHHATVFGGSASAVAILAAWSWLHFILDANAVPARLVIQRNTIDYLAPITGDFEAHCPAPSGPKLERFLRTFARHGRARIELHATLLQRGPPLARFEGEYVAVRLESDDRKS